MSLANNTVRKTLWQNLLDEEGSPQMGKVGHPHSGSVADDGRNPFLAEDQQRDV